jgi:hypothetical protein
MTKTASPPEPKGQAIPQAVTKVRRNNPQARIKDAAQKELKDAIKNAK